MKAYRDGVPISEIQWLMRMKHQHNTLEFYIQEVEVAVRKVKSAAMLFPFLRCESG